MKKHLPKEKSLCDEIMTHAWRATIEISIFGLTINLNKNKYVSYTVKKTDTVKKQKHIPLKKIIYR
jgi:hypothetical protein